MPSSCNTSCKIGQGANCVASRRRRNRKTRRQRGGDNSGALIQLAPVSKATAGLYSPNGGNVQQQMQAEVKDALANVFGPNKIQQFGGRALKRKGHKAKTCKTRRRTHRR
jgi:hypothetical protein